MATIHDALPASISGSSMMKPGHEPNAEGPESAHAATIRRMIEAAPPFRPRATTGELVAEFAHGENRMAAFLALNARGPEVLPAVRAGLTHANPQIRRWCAIVADNFADAETLRALVP